MVLWSEHGTHCVALFIHEECFLGVSMMTIKDEMKECEYMTCESVIREERDRWVLGGAG